MDLFERTTNLELNFQEMMLILGSMQMLRDNLPSNEYNDDMRRICIKSTDGIYNIARQQHRSNLRNYKNNN